MLILQRIADGAVNAIGCRDLHWELKKWASDILRVSTYSGDRDAEKVGNKKGPIVVLHEGASKTPNQGRPGLREAKDTAVMNHGMVYIGCTVDARPNDVNHNTRTSVLI